MNHDSTPPPGPWSAPASTWGGPQHPAPPQASYGVPAPPPRRPGLLVGLVVVISLLTVGGVLFVLAVIPALVAQEASGGACGQEVAPAGASADAVAYLEATNRTAPARQVLSDKIAAAGMQMSTEDLQAAVTMDDHFLADLRAITFSPTAQQPAERMIAAVESYRAFVQRSVDEPGYLSAHRDEDDAVNVERARAGEELRDALGLPQSTCMFNRP